MVDADVFVASMGYAFALLLSAIFIVLSYRGRSDDDVSDNAVKAIVSAFIAEIAAVMFTLAVLAIYVSILYIFGLQYPSSVFDRIWEFGLLVVLPSAFLFGEDYLSKRLFALGKVANVLCNYILGSALIVYTTILYVYMIKIVITATMPLGGLTGMITSFYIVSFVWMMLQQRINNKYYRWFYKWFGYISLPLLVMFFVGLLYRVGEYSFTVGRVYMLAAGIVMIFASTVLIFARRQRFSVILY